VGTHFENAPRIEEETALSFDDVLVWSHVLAIRRHVAAYRAMGFCVIPRDFMTKGAGPPSWSEYQRRQPTDTETDKWFFSDETPKNLAVLLGRISGNLFVLDVDGETAQRIFSERLVELGICNNLRVLLLNCMMQRSGSRRGYHFFFRVSQQLLDDETEGEFYRYLLFEESKKDLWKGPGKHEAITLLSERSLCVLAPSIHPDGKCNWYLWNRKEPGIITTKKELRELFWMLRKDEHHDLDVNAYWRKLKGPWNKAKKKAERNNNDNTVPLTDFTTYSEEAGKGTKVISKRERQNWLDALAKNDRHREGNRHEIMLRLVGGLWHRGYTMESTLEFVEEICHYFGDPEVEDRRRVVTDTWQRGAAGHRILGWSGLDELW
jgi:hypothetical protein